MFKVNKYHSFLIAMIPPLSLAAINIQEISIRHLVSASLVSLLFMGIVSAIAYLFSKNLIKSYLFSTMFFIAIFMYGPLYDFALKITHNLYPVFLGFSIGIVESIVFMFAVKHLVRTGKVEMLSRFFTIVAFIMILQAVATITYNGDMLYRFSNVYQKVKVYFVASSSIESKQIDHTEVISTVDLILDNRPQSNVYYIILDGYPRQDVLLKHYDFDNKYFIDQLSDIGFYIATESHSNYPITDYSLMSSLNMEHINDLKIKNNPELVKKLYSGIQNPKVAKKFKAQGYQYLTISSGWGPTQFQSPLSDRHFISRHSRISTFHQAIINMTPLRWLFNHGDAKVKLYSFEALQQISKEYQSNAFTFLHLLMPHPPFCFTEDGAIRDYSIYEKDSDKDWYVGQLVFLNKILLSAIKEILSNSELDPIIILQSDHGSSILLETQGANPTDAALRERFSNFNAYYAPELLKQKLYSSITPVNSFRLILSSLFEEQYPLLEDRSYFSWYMPSNNFIDITDRLDGPV
jgi:hypothetical protein